MVLSSCEGSSANGARYGVAGLVDKVAHELVLAGCLNEQVAIRVGDLAAYLVKLSLDGVDGSGVVAYSGSCAAVAEASKPAVT